LGSAIERGRILLEGVEIRQRVTIQDQICKGIVMHGYAAEIHVVEARVPATLPLLIVSHSKPMRVKGSRLAVAELSHH